MDKLALLVYYPKSSFLSHVTQPSSNWYPALLEQLNWHPTLLEQLIYVGPDVMVLALMSKRDNMVNVGHGVMILALMERGSIWSPRT
jgi:hypothetical protein